MIKLCIFDLDGTLSNTLESIAFFGNKAMRMCGYPEVGAPQAFRYLVGQGVDVLVRGMLQAVGIQPTAEQEARVRRIFEEEYTKEPLYLVREYEGVRALLQAIREKGVLLAVLSNKPDGMTRQVVSLLFEEIPFARCYGLREDVPRKPSPAGALQIAAELQVEPADCLYIGDTDVDMKTGTGAGMKTVGVLWGFRDEQELRENGAQVIVSSPGEILELM